MTLERVRPKPIVGRSIWLALALVHAMGCVLLTPPIGDSGHCSFEGSSACATCLRSNCVASIDACCNDRSCSGDEGHSTILDALDVCGAGMPYSCAAGIGTGGDSAAAVSMRTCVTTTCKDACVGSASVKVDHAWSCATPRTETNECSTCIYGSCGVALDECCGDSSCSKSSSLAVDMGACTSGDAPGCAYLTTKSAMGFEGKVRACIVKQCATACMGDGRPHASCDLYSGGTYCRCRDDEASRGPDCSVASLGGSCVLGQSGCTCGHYACKRDDIGTSMRACECGFAGGEGGTTTCSVEKKDGQGRCCLHRNAGDFTCECKDYLRSCNTTSGDEYAVPTCDEADVLHALANVLVTKCSN